MTPRETAAYNAGLGDALRMARTVAVTMETAPDATDLRKQAAAAALYAFAEAAEVLSNPNILQQVETASEGGAP